LRRSCGKLVKKEVPQLWKRRGKCAVLEVRGVKGGLQAIVFGGCCYLKGVECSARRMHSDQIRVLCMVNEGANAMLLLRRLDSEAVIRNVRKRIVCKICFANTREEMNFEVF
jgi:hypothetical protein